MFNELINSVHCDENLFFLLFFNEFKSIPQHKMVLKVLLTCNTFTVNNIILKY